MRTRLLAAALLGTLALAPRAARAEDEPSWPKLMAAKAPTVVTVKSVLKISFEGGGGDRETNDERNGVVVDPAGVVMMQNYFGRGRMHVTPKSVRVLFEGDEKEYDAVLGGMDSKLGLAFVRIKDLAGRACTATNIGDSAEVKIGDEVMWVVRTDQGFDYAPYFGTVRVNVQIAKPRPAWLVQGNVPIAHPLYTAEGKVAGVGVQLSGISEEGSSSRYCLLPAKAVVGIVANGVKATAKALEEAKAHDAEAAAGMTEPGMEEPAMAEPAMEGGGDAAMGEAPAGMGA
jgi:hypothetical protein